ncbi:MAG: hypothetical protein HQL82_15320 [Magnetococcales bacterium]|nr:hypothetical protein [Magnetococcales bacterium]
MAVTTLPHEGAVGKGAILALDLGMKTGWALGSPGGRPFMSGTDEFRPGRFEGGGMAFLRFTRWLDEVRTLVAPTGGLKAVCFEEVRAHAGTTAAHVYGGFLGQLTAWCELHQLPYQGVPVGVIKRHATGKGNASKAEMIAAMRAKGHNPGDDNEADALALLYWALAQEVA